MFSRISLSSITVSVAGAACRHSRSMTVLAAYPQRRPPLDLLRGSLGVAQPDDGSRVVRGLQLAGDELHLVVADDAGGFPRT